MIGLAPKVGGRGRFRPVDAVNDRQPYDHDETTDAIERPPPQTTDRFDQWVVDLADDI